MTRTRAAIAGALVVCAVLVAVIAFSSGSDDGPQTFMTRDANSALLIEWTRVGNDVSGSATDARAARATPGLFADTRLAAETPRDVQRNTSTFTGTISDDSVRLHFTGALFEQLNGQLDGDTLKLVIPQDNGPQTVRLTNATRKEFDAAVGQLRAAEVRRVSRARTTRERADAAARAAITRVATAYQKALDGRSPDDPCRYLTAAAKADMLEDAPPALSARGCKAVIRFREREQHRTPYPRALGVAKINLRQLVDVPSETTGRLADGAELRFPAITNHYPIALIQERGRWRIAKYQ